MKLQVYDLILDKKTGIPKLKKGGVKRCDLPDQKLNSPEAVYDVMIRASNILRFAEEHTYMIALNTVCEAIGLFEISKGTADTAIVNPRETFLRALLVGATRIVIIHNHPSRSVKPSNEDRSVTQRLYAAGEILGLPLLDHIIIGDGFYSFTACGDLLKQSDEEFQYYN